MRWPWRRRAAATTDQPHGRHERVDGTPSTVPVDVVEPSPVAVPETPPAPAPVVPTAFAPAVPPEPLPELLPLAPAADLPVPVLDPVAPIVSLGFADGESVALSDDDPRVGSFRAAAAAMLGETTATPRS
jgi:hypothetical protein